MKFIALIFLIASCSTHKKEVLVVDSNIYINKALGLKIEKPADWHYVTKQEHRDNLERAKYKSEDFRRLVIESARSPLYMISKYKEPHSDLNPSLKILLRLVGPEAMMFGIDQMSMAKRFSVRLKEQFENFEVTVKPVETTIGSEKAAYFQAKYIMDERYPAITEMWIIIKNNYMLMISSGSRIDEANGKREEIYNILNTLELF